MVATAALDGINSTESLFVFGEDEMVDGVLKTGAA